MTEEVSQVATCDLGHLTCDDLYCDILCAKMVSHVTTDVTGHGLKKMALVHIF